jgi:hypothetical protein
VSKLLALTAREMRERWLLLAGALASGFFPLILPAFGQPRDVMPVVGAAGAILLGAAAAFITGSSMLARDAANGRLGFLFSRPVSWPVIWTGKWLAALVLSVATGLLAAIPWMVAYPVATVGGRHGDSWLRVMHDVPGAVTCFVAIVLAVGLANFGATLFRSRSPWMALDLVLLLGALWATRRFVAPLLLFGVVRVPSGWPPVLPVLPLAIGFLAGSMAQVAFGRTDVRRAHAALSIAFWTVVGVALVTAAGYWRWSTSAGLSDVNAYAMTAGPGGKWIHVEGWAARSGHYAHGFLVDTTSGRHARLPGPSGDFERRPLGLQFSADGRSAAVLWIGGQAAELDVYELASRAPKVTEVVLESSPPPTSVTAFALSPNSQSVFVVHESGASLFALPSGRRVATVTIGPGWRPAVVRFLSEEEARTWLVPSTEGPRGRAREMRVVDLAADGTSRGATFPLTAALEPDAVGRGVVADASGRRLLTPDQGVRLRDGATGALIATLSEGEGRLPWETRLPGLFLADGRVVVGAGAAGAKARLLVFGQDGTKLGEVPLELWPWGLTVGPEVAPGRVAVCPFRSPYQAEESHVVDVGEGRVVERLPGLRPAIGFWMVAALPANASPTTVHFFRDAQGGVIRIDFATGERKVVAGPGAPAVEPLRLR